MEFIFSLGGHDHFLDILKFCVWNINGVGDKFTNDYVISLFQENDIIFISESKCISANFPGFFSIGPIGDFKYAHHGGVMFLIRNHLKKLIHKVNISKNMIYFSLKHMPDVIVCGCYLVPDSSKYYTLSAFALLQELASQNDKYILLFGDLNSRFGTRLNEIALNDHYEYINMNDTCSNLNSNAQMLKSIIRDNKLVVVNNLKYGRHVFNGNLTFRRSGNWVSEIDWLIVSDVIMKNDLIKKFNIPHISELPSNHAPVTFELNCNFLIKIDHNMLLNRANNLGRNFSNDYNDRKCYAPLRLKDIDISKFETEIDLIETIDPIDDTLLSIDKLSNDIYNAMKCAKNNVNVGQLRNDNVNGWDFLLNNNDERLIWKAINWKGEVNAAPLEKPRDEEFASYYKELLSKDIPDLNIDNFDLTSCPEIPVLDQPLVHDEIENGINSMKTSVGQDGTDTGIFRYLNPHIMTFITLIFNIIFFCQIYPEKWGISKLTNIFKKGNRLNCSNYRGLSIMNSFSKLYDICINKRICQWYTPLREQAACQKGRSCLDNILCLRILISIAKMKKFKLYVCFIDFSKAYDRVNRSMIIQTLIALGCSVLMIYAIFNMYRNTTLIIGAAIITVNIGLRQGAPTSCILFIMIIEKFIRDLKLHFPNDGFLGWLSSLAFMDDLVILSTSRESMICKLQLLDAFCDEYNMSINESKSNYFVINPFEDDTSSLFCGNKEISHVDYYKYLGCIFTADGKISTSITEHSNAKQNQVFKFVNFIRVKLLFPFFIKRKVLNAALNASLLYSCESWFGENISCINKHYMNTIKCILNVRPKVANTVSLIEIGMPTLKAFIRNKQQKTYYKLINDNSRIESEDPFIFAYKLGLQYRNIHATYIQQLANDNTNILHNDLIAMRNEIRDSNRTKFLTYLQINPELKSPDVYNCRSNIFNELQRTEFTRLRTSSHDLRIEIGRWDRPITPRENRLCTCDNTSIQDEWHVIQNCLYTAHIRSEFSDINFNNFFENNSTSIILLICFRINQIFTRNT